MKSRELLHFLVWSFLFMSPCVYAVPDIDVVPGSYDFGEVEVGTSETVEIVINNVGDSSITISAIYLQSESGEDYSVDVPYYLPMFFSAGGHKSVEVTFSPSDNSASSAVLQIDSSDPDEPVVEVVLTGQGVGGEITPLEQIDAILEFSAAAVEAETLVGKGRGKSAKNRLNAFVKMLESAESLIEEEQYDQACGQLRAAYKHCDGQNRPADFVAGDAASELADKIMALIEALEAQE